MPWPVGGEKPNSGRLYYCGFVVHASVPGAVVLCPILSYAAGIARFCGRSSAWTGSGARCGTTCDLSEVRVVG